MGWPNYQEILCLNPCSNGILKYAAEAEAMRLKGGLNPCSNGILKYNVVACRYDSTTVS